MAKKNDTTTLQVRVLQEHLSEAVNVAGRIEFSLEGPDDCAICQAAAQQELVSQGRLP